MSFFGFGQGQIRALPAQFHSYPSFPSMGTVDGPGVSWAVSGIGGQFVQQDVRLYISDSE